MSAQGNKTSDSKNNNLSLSTTISTIAVVAIVGTCGYWSYQLVSAFGFSGALRYIWEGSPWDEQIRDGMRTLDDAESSIDLLEEMIELLEATLRHAREESFDDLSLIQEWETASGDLQGRLGQLSYDLDKVAARIDGVVSNGRDELKRRKKHLSAEVVLLMSRADTLISVFQNAESESEV